MGLRLDELDVINQGPITHPHLILCEGKGDAAFFRALTAKHGLDGFQIGYPSEEKGMGGGFGKDAFAGFLKGLPTRSGYKSTLRTILIATDNDSNPDESFRKVSTRIGEAGLTVPTRPLEIAQGTPRVTVLMLPEGGKPGVLETLLLAACDKSPTVTKCLEEYADCTGAKTWPQGQLDKMRLRSLISASCQQDPECSITWIWKKNYNPISLDNACFDPLLTFLRQILV
jgi:hypothetical protein